MSPVNPAGSSGYIVNAAPAATPSAVVLDNTDAEKAAAATLAARAVHVTPTAVETLEHLERTLDNLDPVVADKAADAVIADITGAHVEAVEPAPIVPEGTEHPHGDAPKADKAAKKDKKK